MHHGEGLRRLLGAKGVTEAAQDDLIAALVGDPRGGPSMDAAAGASGRPRSRPDSDIAPAERAAVAPESQAILAPADRAMLAYADRLTLSPGDIDAREVGALREHGFDDRAIHDVCAIVAYYAFVNRIADGLGVELEDGRGA